MRRDGDALLMLMGRARSEVVLCAPFIKEAVLKALLARVDPGVSVTVATRWRPEEIAAGVSDLEVYNCVRDRPGAQLKLLDRLHAKLYVADGSCLMGSANLTATALGWTPASNLELLLPVDPGEDAVAGLLALVAAAPPVGSEDKRAMEARVDALPTWEARPPEVTAAVPAGPWLPTCAAPRRLYAVYRATDADRLTEAVSEAGRHDLEALGIEPGLGRAEFAAAVADALGRMPAIRLFLEAAGRDLPDDEAVRLVAEIGPAGPLDAETRWRMLWEWLTCFFPEEIELAPSKFVLRRRPTTSGR